MNVDLFFAIYFGIGALLLAGCAYSLFYRTEPFDNDAENEQAENERQGFVVRLHMMREVMRPEYFAGVLLLVSVVVVFLWLPLIAWALIREFTKNAN